MNAPALQPTPEQAQDLLVALGTLVLTRIAEAAQAGPQVEPGAKGRRAPGRSRSKTPEYLCWIDLRRRCLDPRHPAFPRYGGRGVGIDPRWANSFAAFRADMGERPGPGYSIDRIANDGPYSPANCRWATAVEQNNNRRDNIRVTVGGRTYSSLKLACRALALPYVTVWARIRSGWDPARALGTPVRRRSEPNPG